MRLKFLFSLFLILIISVANSQIVVNFDDLPNMNIRRGLIATSSNTNSLFVCHGFSPTANFVSEIEKYDIANQQWTIFANSTIAKRYPSAEVVGNNLYIFNGITAYVSGGEVFNEKLEKVDLQTGGITFLTDNPYPVRSAGNCVWNNYIYFFGGKAPSGYSNKLLKYSVDFDEWTFLADMPVGRETRGEVVDGKIYVIGGYNGTPLNRIDVYDIQTNLWEHVLNMPTGISANSTAVYGRKIWVVGDYTNQTQIGYYDIDTNEYISCISQNMIGRRHFGAEIVDGNLYIMGGNQTSSSSSTLNSLQYANISTASVFENVLNSIKVYPNPCVSNLSISSPEPVKEINIENFQGKTVLRMINPKKINNINLSKLSKGTYFVTVKLNKFLISKRIIKK